jgi:predicted Fe-Mo cluster-binding NifX family protein
VLVAPAPVTRRTYRSLAGDLTLQRATPGTASVRVGAAAPNSPEDTVIIAIPVDADDQVAPGWGRAPAIALATVADGQITDWQVHDVRWDAAHDEGTEGSHHARVVRFLRDNAVELVVAEHMGDGMVRTLASMHLPTVLGAAGDARASVLAAVETVSGTA